MENFSVRSTEDVVRVMKFLISSCLSYGVVVGASVLKLPQIFSILRSESAAGVSLSGNLVELLAYVISLSWGINQRFDFRDFGENAIIFVQLLGLVGLVAYHQQLKGRAAAVVTAEMLAFYALLSGRIPTDVHKTLLSGQILLNVGSRVPQIWMNYRNKSTGQLSALTFFLAMGGGVARVMTTALNVPWPKGKAILLLQYTVAVSLNLMVLFQIVLYRSKRVKVE